MLYNIGNHLDNIIGSMQFILFMAHGCLAFSFILDFFYYPNNCFLIYTHQRFHHIICFVRDFSILNITRSREIKSSFFWRNLTFLINNIYCCLFDHLYLVFSLDNIINYNRANRTNIRNMKILDIILSICINYFGFFSHFRGVIYLIIVIVFIFIIMTFKSSRQLKRTITALQATSSFLVSRGGKYYKSNG